MSLFPPSNACLRRCIRTPPYTPVRYVSRTSAINRGLRASRPANRGGGRQAPPVERAVRIKKHTSHDDEVFGTDAPKQRLRNREDPDGRDGGRDRGRDVRKPDFSRAARNDRSFGGRDDAVRPSRGGGERMGTFGKDMRRDLDESSGRRSSFIDRSEDRRQTSGASAFGRERRQDAYEASPGRSDSLGEPDGFRKTSRSPTARSSEYREARDRSVPRRSSYDDAEDTPSSFRSRDRDAGERRPERYQSRDQGRGDERGDSARQSKRYLASDERPAKPSWAERKTQEDRPSSFAATESRSTDRPARRDWTERKAQDERLSRSSDRIRNEDNDVPVSIPYSTASSQFIYGTNSVLAALKAQRRKCHHLHVRDSRTIGRDNAINEKTETLVRLARQSGIKVSHSATLRLLDKMSDNRPHNGVVLEASALPAPPLVSLGTPADASVPLSLDRQSAEDTATNGAPESLPAPKRRSPLILFLDGITDPGNVGAILRTAHFFNVDAVAIATNTCANLASPVLAKASAGACEAVPIFAVKKPAEFVYKSKKDGWKIYAAVAPDAKARKAGKQKTSVEVSGASPLFTSPQSEGGGVPVILMLGAEGEGLRENLRSKADVEVTIERGGGRGGVDVGVDSVNVSVAAGVLVDAFMRRPRPAVVASPVAASGDPPTAVKERMEASTILTTSIEDTAVDSAEAAVEETEEATKEPATLAQVGESAVEDTTEIQTPEALAAVENAEAVVEDEKQETKKEEDADANVKGLGF